MLVAHTAQDFGADVRFDAAFASTPAYLLHAVTRTGMHLDTRVFPTVRMASRAVRVLWLVLEGWVEVGEERVTAPVLFAMPESAYLGQARQRFLHYRTGGATFRALEVRLRSEEPLLRPAQLTGPVVERAAALFGVIRAEAEEPVVTAGLNALLQVLPDWARTPPIPPQPSTHVVAEAARRVYRALDVSTSIKQLSALENVTSKVMEHALTALLGDHLLPSTHWRDMTTYARLGLATLLLSAESIPIGDIARRVGYARTQALDHAFDAAGLASPSAVRRFLLAGGSVPNREK